MTLQTKKTLTPQMLKEMGFVTGIGWKGIKLPAWDLSEYNHTDKKRIAKWTIDDKTQFTIEQDV